MFPFASVLTLRSSACPKSSDALVTVHVWPILACTSSVGLWAWAAAGPAARRRPVIAASPIGTFDQAREVIILLLLTWLTGSVGFIN
jgi:hypothetical protein